MFLKLLTPDKSNIILNLYHKSNKMIIPFIIPSLFLDEDSKIKKYFDFINVNNLIFHSFISFSSIITDYHKKIPFFKEPILRITNLKTHIILYLFVADNLYKKYYMPELYNSNYLKRRKTLLYDYDIDFE